MLQINNHGLGYTPIPVNSSRPIFAAFLFTYAGYAKVTLKLPKTATGLSP